MICGVGIDVCEVERIRKLLDRYNIKFINRVYTEKESIKKNPQSLAARFAAKEAAAKALGADYIFSLKEIEIINEPSGKPKINLYGNALKRAEQLSINNIEVSLTHIKDIAIAVVILEKKEG